MRPVTYFIKRYCKYIFVRQLWDYVENMKDWEELKKLTNLPGNIMWDKTWWIEKSNIYPRAWTVQYIYHFHVGIILRLTLFASDWSEKMDLKIWDLWPISLSDIVNISLLDNYETMLKIWRTGKN